MLNALLAGIGFGLMLAFIPGPVFFALIQTGINKGFRYGILFAIGVALSDIAFILLTYFGVSGFLSDPFLKKIFSLCGGIFMCAIGVFYFFKKQKKSIPYEQITKQTGAFSFVVKGFALNILNPFVFFFWIGMVSVISLEFQENEYQILAFFITSVATVFGVDIVKSFVANLIKSYFTQRFLFLINKGLGIILFGFGVRLLAKAFIGSESLF
jgi:threonine/homoserine/homoserine lactone efflux protein